MSYESYDMTLLHVELVKVKPQQPFCIYLCKKLHTFYRFHSLSRANHTCIHPEPWIAIRKAFPYSFEGWAF